jgi:hypothetical protein
MRNCVKLTGCRGRLRTSTEWLALRKEWLGPPATSFLLGLFQLLHPRDRRACLPVSSPYSVLLACGALPQVGCRGRLRTSTGRLALRKEWLGCLPTPRLSLSRLPHPRDRRACLPVSSPYSVYLRSVKCFISLFFPSFDMTK